MALRIFGSPHRYYQGPGALRLLPRVCDEIGGKPAVVIDAEVLKLTGDLLADIFANVDHVVLPFSGEVTVGAMAGLAERVRAAGASLVIGIGGGKALDAAKGSAIRAGARYVSAPTVASNDSPTGMTLAVYDDCHNIAAIESMARSPEAVVVDTALMASAPAHFLRAGIGDAIAKKFEAEASRRDGGLSAHFAMQTITGLTIADGCYRTIREHGVAALAAAGSGEPTPAFDAVVEACVLMAGLGFENGGLGLAHGLVRGLVRVPEIAKAAHGLHVAYGLLVMLVSEGRSDAFIADVEECYASLGLPLSLRDLGPVTLSPQLFETIAQATAIAPAGAYLKLSAKEAEIVAALERTEARARGV